MKEKHYVHICENVLPEKHQLSVVQHRKTGNDFSPQRLSHHSGSFDRPTPPLGKVGSNHSIINCCIISDI